MFILINYLKAKRNENKTKQIKKEEKRTGRHTLELGLLKANIRIEVHQALRQNSVILYDRLEFLY